MAVPPNAMPPPEQQQVHDGEKDDDFTFPTFQHLPSCSPSPCSSPPVWLHLPYSPIRRSFSAASPLRRYRGGGWSPALSDYAGFCCDGEEEEEEEEERMDSLWEDLNDEDDPFHDVSRRRSVGGERRAASQEKELGAGASRSSRRLVVMMRALKKMFVAHKGKSRVHKVG